MSDNSEQSDIDALIDNTPFPESKPNLLKFILEEIGGSAVYFLIGATLTIIVAVLYFVLFA